MKNPLLIRYPLLKATASGTSVLFYLLVLLSCNGSKPLATESTTRIAKLELLFKTYEEKGFSGTMLLAEEGKVHFERSTGYAERETRTRNTPETLFNVASISKLFTAVAILQLQQAGKLNINDPLEKYLGEWPPEKRSATVHHLLCHQAGLVPRGYDLDYSTRELFLKTIKSAPAEAGYRILKAN